MRKEQRGRAGKGKAPAKPMTPGKKSGIELREDELRKVSGGTTSAGRASFSDFTIMKTLDKTSP
jgi:hypothetical protein